MRWVLLLLALGCGLGLLAMSAGATSSDSTTVAISVDENVGPSDASAPLAPAAVGSDEPVGTADDVAVQPPASVPGEEGVSVTDDVSVVPPVSILDEESVSPADEQAVVPPAVVSSAETATTSDEVSVVPTSSPTTTTVTASPSPALVGSPVAIDATVSAGGHAVSSGSVTFEDGATPLGPAVAVDATGHASISVSTLALGSHTIVAAYGGTSAFDASSAMTSEGIYDYALAAGPDRTVLRGATAPFGVTLSLVAGSATTGLPASVPFSALLPSDATSDAPSSIAFPQTAASPTSLTVDVHTGSVTLGDVAATFTAGARSATAGLHVYDYTLSLAPSSQTVQRGSTASFSLGASLALGSTTLGLPATIGLTTSPGATAAGPLALPGSTTVTVPTGGSTPPGAQTVTVTGDPGARVATASLYVNVPPVPSAGGPYTATEGSTLTLHGSATDTAGETLTYTWDLGGGATATGATPSITVGDGPATQTLTLTVCDDRGACASDTATLTIANVPPTARILAPADGSVLRAGRHVTLSGSFTDPGVLDTHTATWTVGSTAIPATISEHNGNGTATAVWTPTAAGFYPLSLTVRDKDGGTTTVGGGTLVVFDPDFAVAGAGALVDPGHDLVLFAFSARYRDGDATPRGDVDAKAPHLLLDATRFDVLVVTPPSFVLEGDARVNGHAGYSFRLDGTNGHPDQLRIRIWSPSGALVYDSSSRPLAFGGLTILH